MNDISDGKKKLAFEEFQLFYESTEKVTDRRLGANRWNYSICIAILIAVAAITNWGLLKPSFLIISIIAIVVLSGMAALFCSLWIGQIRDFKALNNAKFEVLNNMAPYVVFGDSQNDSRISYSPFEREWNALQKAQAVQEVSHSNIIALKASNMEYLIPRAFRILYVLIILGALTFSVVNWSKIINSSSLTFQSPITNQTKK